MLSQKLFQSNKCYVWQPSESCSSPCSLDSCCFMFCLAVWESSWALPRIHSLMIAQSFVHPLLCNVVWQNFHLLKGTSLNGDRFMAPSLSPLSGGDCISSRGHCPFDISPLPPPSSLLPPPSSLLPPPSSPPPPWMTTPSYPILDHNIDPVINL